MPTSSFDHPIIIRTEEALDRLLEGLANPRPLPTTAIYEVMSKEQVEEMVRRWTANK